MVVALEANDFPVQHFVCNEDPFVRAQRAEKLLNDMSKVIEENNLIHVDDDLRIWQDLRFEVKMGLETAAIVDKLGVKPLANQKIKVARRFFRIGVTESVPYTYYKRDPKTSEIIRDDNNLPIYEGFCIDMINEIARKMNFTFELVEPATGTFGERKPDGSFDGVVGDLITGKTDMIIAALKITAEREEHIDFVAPHFEQTGIHIVMKKVLNKLIHLASEFITWTLIS